MPPASSGTCGIPPPPGSPAWKPTAGLQAERDQLAADLRAAHRPARTSTGPGAKPGRRVARRDGPTKRDQMIELAGQRRDLATVPLAEVSQLASAVAAEIGYSPGTARRELVRHVRELQAAPRETRPQDRQEEAAMTDRAAARNRAGPVPQRHW